MNKNLSRLIRHRTSKKGDTAQLAAQLAPLEELNKSKEQGDGVTSFQGPVAHQEVGAIIVEANSPGDETDQRRKEKTLLGLEPVVVVILCLMLGFIAFIAWQISQMPPQ
jgi:hypothetical protein